MFSFFNNNHKNTTTSTHAITERDQATMNTLQEAFGVQASPLQPLHEMGRTPARAPRVEISDATVPVSHLAPSGHRLEEHHIWENCLQGRKRQHCDQAINPGHVTTARPPESMDNGDAVGTVG